MSNVVPYFELYIRPMFRLIDRDHMLWFADLHDYESVKTNAPDIGRLLRRDAPGFMPTPDFGGPWPEQWIQVFEAWVAGGYPRLNLARGTYDLVRVSDGSLLLNVSFSHVNGADTAWIEREQAPPSVREYTSYLRPAPSGVVEPARVFQHVEVLSDPQIAQVVIVDADGRRPLTLPS
jgi:hypothetical protein